MNMFRGMAIKGVGVLIGAALLTKLVNVVHAQPGLALAVLSVYSIAGTLFILSYPLKHPDEIPVRPRHPDHHS
jgi:hypothetical protein